MVSWDEKKRHWLIRLQIGEEYRLQASQNSTKRPGFRLCAFSSLIVVGRYLICLSFSSFFDLSV